jgi:hypothetical protein
MGTSALALELFRPPAMRVASPFLTVSPRIGRIGFNSACVNLLREARIKAVALLWDTETRWVVIRAPRKGEDASGTVAFNPNHNSASLACKEFLRFIRWNSEENKGLPAIWNPKEKQLEIRIPAECIGSFTVQTVAPKGSKARKGGSRGKETA